LTTIVDFPAFVTPPRQKKTETSLRPIHLFFKPVFSLYVSSRLTTRPLLRHYSPRPIVQREAPRLTREQRPLVSDYRRHTPAGDQVTLGQRRGILNVGAAGTSRAVRSWRNSVTGGAVMGFTRLPPRADHGLLNTGTSRLERVSYVENNSNPGHNPEPVASPVHDNCNTGAAANFRCCCSHCAVSGVAL